MEKRNITDERMNDLLLCLRTDIGRSITNALEYGAIKRMEICGERIENIFDENNEKTPENIKDILKDIITVGTLARETYKEKIEMNHKTAQEIFLLAIKGITKKVEEYFNK
jgi:hypothetical protein